MSPFCHRFILYRPIPPHAITAANKHTFYAVGMGDLQIQVPNGDTLTPFLLQDTLYAPNMGVTIVVINRIAKADYSVAFKDDSCKIKDEDGTVVGSIPASTNGLYKVQHDYTGAATLERVDLHTLHRCLGHILADSIRSLVRNNAITGLQLIDNKSPFICDSCEHAKLTHKNIRKEQSAPQADAFGAEIHTDVWGPSPTLSLSNRKYYITFTDYTHYTKIDLIKSKDEAFSVYKNFAMWVKTQHGIQIKHLRSDRGGEYTSGDFSKYLKEQGTKWRLTTHDTPQHNGVVESLNCWLLERVRAVLHHTSLLKNLWGEAIHFIVWLKNRTSTKTLGNVTLYECLYGAKPDLAGVPEWGQCVWVLNDAGSKLNVRATQAHWVGYNADSTHAHRMFWPNKNKVSVKQNIKFVPPTVTPYAPRYVSVTPLKSKLTTAQPLMAPQFVIVQPVAQSVGGQVAQQVLVLVTL